MGEQANETEQEKASLLQALQETAEKGNAEAQYRLGMAYANGDGVSLDFRTAADWISKAAMQGLTEAQRTLAWLYANGYGVVQSNEEARRWFLTAARSGDPVAQCTVASMYQFGRYDTEKDRDAMLYWYQQAAANGYARAQFALGKLMSEGTLVEQDDERAFQWLTMAILGGSEPAKQELAKLTARLDEKSLAGYKERMLEAMQQHPGGTA